jgi:RNA polymerase sigma-70 factor (ECF subfamily)
MRAFRTTLHVRLKADTMCLRFMSDADSPPERQTAQRDGGLAPDEIIERCLNGDQGAWETIVRLYWRKVFNVAYKFVGRHDMAEDLTQDVFLKLYKSLDTFDRRANFQTWLISVSRNLCIDHYRSVRKERETINRDVDASELSPVSHDVAADTRLERHDRVVLLRQALDKLAPTLRTAVMLRDIQELTYQEIADTELARQIQKLREQQDAIPRTGVSG